MTDVCELGDDEIKERLCALTGQVTSGEYEAARKIIVEVCDRLARGRRCEAAAQKLLSLVEHKDEPSTSENNRKLMATGDVILVNEGYLWELQAALAPEPEQP